MTNTQVSTARKFAVAAFSGVVALSLMLPTQLAFADYNVGDQTYSGTEDKSGEGSEGGTWSYTAEGQEMTLVDYVGAAISATEQDLNIQLEGDNKVESRINVQGGNLTITGDSSVYGENKPGLTITESARDAENAKEYANYKSNGYISATSNYRSEDKDGKGSVTIKDVNLAFETDQASISAQNGDLTIQDSKIDPSSDGTLSISATGRDNGNTIEKDVLLKGSEITATSVHASGTLTIDNTNLTVNKPSDWDETNKSMLEWYKRNFNYDYKWLEHAVSATKIVLKGEENGTVVDAVDHLGKAYQYLTTGSDDKIELKASSTPAYWGGTKGMPATGDATMPLAVGLSITAMAAAGFVLYSRKSAYAGKHVK